MKKTIIVISILLFGSGIYAHQDRSTHQKQETKQSNKSDTGPTFKDLRFSTAYNSYILLKNALVTDNFEEAKKHAARLFELLEGISNASTAQQGAKKILNSTTINEQREIFIALSEEMMGIAKQNELTKGEVYLEYCPMANDHKGAYWLANEKEIKNPYYGSKMLKCGTVKETIK